MSNWIRFEPDAGVCVPEVPGCYVIFGDGEVVYVGQTVNMRMRMRSHGIRIWHYSAQFKTPWGNFSELYGKRRVSKRYGDWAMVEVRLINRLNPPGNKRKPR